MCYVRIKKIQATPTKQHRGTSCGGWGCFQNFRRPSPSMLYGCSSLGICHQLNQNCFISQEEILYRRTSYFFTLRFVKKTGYAAGKRIMTKNRLIFKMSAAVEITGANVLLGWDISQTFSTSHALSRTPAMSHVVVHFFFLFHKLINLLLEKEFVAFYISLHCFTWCHHITEPFSAQKNTDRSNSTRNVAKCSRITCNELGSR